MFIKYSDDMKSLYPWCTYLHPCTLKSFLIDKEPHIVYNMAQYYGFKLMIWEKITKIPIKMWQKTFGRNKFNLDGTLKVSHLDFLTFLKNL